MERKLYYFIACVLSISYATRGSDVTRLDVSKKAVDLPLVKFGVNLSNSDMWNIQKHGSFLGIVGGRVTNITEHPYQIAIDKDKSFVCAGALLNRIWAITLASCLQGGLASSLTVRAGSNSNIYGGTEYNVTSLVVHPNFNYTTMDYDYALLKLNTYLCYDKTTDAIEFSERGPKRQYDSVISGWGNSHNKATNQFRELNMTVMSEDACEKKYENSEYSITGRMFCAASKNKGPCYNDFGDPLVVNGTLYGLYSWSLGCANPNYPAVFSNIANVSDWIHTTMNNACTCGVLY